MLSGGPDSTLALVEALATGAPIIALHVSFISDARRHEYERAACRRIVARLRQGHPDLAYREAAVVPPPGSGYADLPVLGVFAAMLVNSFGDIGKIWVGDDTRQGDHSADEAFLTVMRAAALPARFPQMRMPSLYAPAPGTDRSKQEIREALGEPLWELTWSCRRPNLVGAICGACENCVDRNATHAP